MATQNDSEITRLKEAVAGTFGKTLDSPTDFDALALSIQGKTGEYISPTTLKRLFGYVKPATVPRTSTLSVLARYVGKTGWSDFSAQPVHQEPAEQPAQSEPSVPSAPVERKDGIRKYLPLLIAATILLIGIVAKNICLAYLTVTRIIRITPRGLTTISNVSAIPLSENTARKKSSLCSLILRRTGRATLGRQSLRSWKYQKKQSPPLSATVEIP